MPIQVSPGVVSIEVDLTTVPAAIATTTGAMAGTFRWGPMYTPTLVQSEDQLAEIFQGPNANNYETFFTGKDFLDYASALMVTRVGNTTGFSNTLQGTYSNSTVFVATGSANVGVDQSGVQVGNYVVTREGQPGAQVTAISSSGANTTITISLPTSATGAHFVGFTSANAVFTAMANNSQEITKPFSTYNVGNSSNYYLIKQNFGTDVKYIGRSPGAIGNSLQISQCETKKAFSRNINLLNFDGDSSANNGTVDTSANNGNTNITFTPGSNTVLVTLANSAGANDIMTANLATNIVAAFTSGDLVGVNKSFYSVSSVGSIVVGNTAGVNTGITTFKIHLSSPFTGSRTSTQTSVSRYWQYYNATQAVSGAPTKSPWFVQHGNANCSVDEIHVIISDALGHITGIPGQILESYGHLSRATDSRTVDGASTNYYAEVLNQNSKYVWFASDRTGAASNTAANLVDSSKNTPMTSNFIGGSDGDSEGSIDFGILADGYDKYRASENIDISLLLAGKSVGGLVGEGLGNYLTQEIIPGRLDCVAFVSPTSNLVVQPSGAVPGQEALNIVSQFANVLAPSSYLVVDSGYKLTYDKYADLYRYVPLNGDIAGTVVYTDTVRDSWWSPAGFTRGQIKNVVKLAFNPTKPDRDILYPAFINPVVSFPGRGTILYGDKTYQGFESAFSRINVRRLFIYLEKIISTAAANLLFEFNDPFTRAEFVAMVTPILRDIQGRRGITDFLVKCDETNNTGEVIDGQRFVGQIFIKPARSINFIELYFTAVGTSVDFSEIVGGSLV